MYKTYHLDIKLLYVNIYCKFNYTENIHSSSLDPSEDSGDRNLTKSSRVLPPE